VLNPNFNALIRQIKTGWLPIPMSIYPPPRKPLLWEHLPEPETHSKPSEFLDRLEDSVHRNLKGCHRVGVLLSGGIDSSVLLTLVNKYHWDILAFTIDFSTYPDEIQRAEKIADKTVTRLIRHQMNVGDHLALLRETLALVHQPIDIETQVLVAERLASDFGCDTVFSALGADEIMAGYPAHISCSPIDFPRVEAEQLEICQAHYVYIHSTLSPLPVKYPYLDPTLISYARGLPLACKRDGDRTKVLMRRAVKGLIPEENRLHGEVVKTKYGFGPNFDVWWRQGLKDWVYREIGKLPPRIALHFMPEIVLNRAFSLRGRTLIRLASVPLLLEVHKELGG
jgi:asparagine synthetase B (glutamine-hydrolysing)